MDKENATIDVGGSRAVSRKSRSKSLGPGGLDALKQSAGNRRAVSRRPRPCRGPLLTATQSLAAPLKLPRSILKQSISALPEIPPLKSAVQKSGAADNGRESTSGSSLSSEDSLGSKLPLRTDEEQQAAAKEWEERERRDARRKSLANRRVSFAAEATLHTFHEVEYMQDSTTSTDSTRRASSSGKYPGQVSAAGVGEEAHRPRAENVPQSPADHPRLQQRRRRTSSGIPPMSFSSAEDDTLASTAYSSDSEPADAVEEMPEDEEENSNSDSDDGTMMTIDTEEVTGTSVAWDRSTAPDEDSTLDEALRIAARRAVTHNSVNDQGEDEDDGEEVIPSFGWVKRKNQSSDKPSSRQSPVRGKNESQQEENDDGIEMEMDMDADMDMTHGVGRILKSTDNYEADQQDLSMDVTQAFGGILSQDRLQGIPGDQEADAADDATMELTAAIGGIRTGPNRDLDDVEDNEEMSMELTTIMGGVLSKPRDERVSARPRRSLSRQVQVDEGDAAMNMTVGVGRIMTDSEQDNAEATTSMDMTTAIGGIIRNGQMSPRTLNKRIMEEEVDRPDSPRKAIVAAVTQQSPSRKSWRALQTESPGISAFQGKGLRRSLGPPTQTPSTAGSPSRTPSPSKRRTPQRPLSSAGKREVDRQSPRPQPALPKKPSPPKEKKTPPSAKAAQRRASVFQHKPETGGITTAVVLTPSSKRELSGVGVDRAGLGSPRVAALCDRRGSIGDLAPAFVAGKRAVAFAEAKELEGKIGGEAEENRGKSREGEADGSQEDKDATLNLREMINSLSPKWKPVRGRKSLHVGSAKGLLGKRPVELEGDDEAEDNDGIKRLKGHQSSPVKNVLLQQPSSKSETTGRLTRGAWRSLEQTAGTCTPSCSSPTKAHPATPRSLGRAKDTEAGPSSHEGHLGDGSAGDEAEAEREEKMDFQGFLNLTSIRFMELTTTKRRHTVAPAPRESGGAADGHDGLSLEHCVVAGACTVPMLELYQHSCRELKKYISEGRRMVKEIELETFEENPPLFREYMTASPDVKALMDNQFKNVKTHARLLSKAMWYDWRMKLQQGLKEGLVSMAEGMESDSRLLQEQQDLLDSVLPAIAARHETLRKEQGNLQQAAQELADCDPDQLASARQELEALEEEAADKRRQIAALRGQLERSAAEVEELTQEKTRCTEEMAKAEQMRENHRGWTSSEVGALKARVEAMEREHGWVVTGVAGSSLSMAYRRDIELVVDVGPTQPEGARRPIQLRYVGDAREDGAVPRTTDKEVVLQWLRDHVESLYQGGATLADVVAAVQAGWDRARLVSRQLSRINIVFPTAVARTSDSSLSAMTSLLLAPLRTRVEVTLVLRGGGGGEVSVSAAARVIYGESFNTAKMEDFVCSRIGGTVRPDRGEDWSDVFVELRRRLIARGRK